ncbi:cilia- and flagella-associated protein 100 [Sphaeramia orbicularis]|uniref:cilia- and flagella-associated protein 100 n=1 Tax=Sphaeramia orbicularis TaxID=375764 RepID=UPI00117C05D8|nr:cilia- and flagella-associated protein 100-like [Sphaeramia orbicularis]
MSSPQMNLRRRRARQQSPFKVPHSSSIFLQSLHEKEDKKEEISEFLALPIVEKTSRATQMIGKQRKELAAQLEEKNEERDNREDAVRNAKQTKPTKSKTVFPKQTAARRELKMAMMKQENITRDRKHDLITMERQKAVLELSLLTKRSEILKMDKAIIKEEKELKELEASIKKDNLFFEECLKEHEKKSVEARTFFEREAKSKQEKMAEIKRLTAEIVTIRSDLEKIEDTLINYNRYKELLFKLSPPEWREAQRVKALNAKGLEGTTSVPAEDESSDHSNKQLTDSKQEVDTVEFEEEEPELYFTDPQQLVDLLTELTEQNLSLIQNSARVEETLEELRQAMEITKKKIEQDEEHLTLQINDIKQRIDTEKARGAKLKQKVQLHVSLNTEDEDIMLDALGEKVSDVYHCCVDDRMTNLNTLEKLANIENSMSVMLQSLESIPEENLELMKKIKDSERRTREREEKLIEQRKKQKERMQRYLERSLADSKKIIGRKLMPRCIPVTQKVKVTNVENIPAEDELQAYLFTSDDME